MGENVTDAEFEVIYAPPRRGDRNPNDPRWICTGRVDAFGNTVWYRPPRFRRWQIGLAAVLAIPLFNAAVYIVAEALAHH